MQTRERLSVEVGAPLIEQTRGNAIELAVVAQHGPKRDLRRRRLGEPIDACRDRRERDRANGTLVARKRKRRLVGARQQLGLAMLATAPDWSDGMND